MGSSISAYWPGIEEAQGEAQPGFYNNCEPWADWTIRRGDEPAVLETLRGLGLAAIETFTTDGVDDSEVKWVSPAELKVAATRLRDLILAHDPRVKPVVQSYACGARHESPPEEQFAQDLADIAGMADFAEHEGAKRITLRIGW